MVLAGNMKQSAVQQTAIVNYGIFLQPLPEYKLRCNSKAKSGTWFSRDNVTNFLGWCRAYGMTDETMFDSEDLGTLFS